MGVVVGSCLENSVYNFAVFQTEIAIVFVPVFHGIERPLNFDLEKVLRFLFGFEGNTLSLVFERHVGEVAREVCNASVILQFHDWASVFVDCEFVQENAEDFSAGV